MASADSGFGKEIVEDLHQPGGYALYSTCLTKETVEKYQTRDLTRLRAIQVDVINQDDANRLRAQVETGCLQGVYAVLNNADMVHFLVLRYEPSILFPVL